MKRSILATSLCALLSLGSFAALAQTTGSPTEAQPPPPSSDVDQNKVDPQDQSKGQELVGDQKPTPTEARGHPSPPTTGQDKSSGNNLVAEDNGKMQSADKSPPDFNTVDVQKRGYITLAEANKHMWLRENFARCDTNHDGQLTQQEYSQCLY